ncbi:GDSL-type esterase/lipase family protein [Spongisporangium articulatum]|uniref:GDSL-type esterase/lipase family protein n=1 Tax=Spongisporangium articulatum TaxID=3362603 RepID=A0ABW8ANG9_9ACTN
MRTRIVAMVGVITLVAVALSIRPLVFGGNSGAASVAAVTSASATPSASSSASSTSNSLTTRALSNTVSSETVVVGLGDSITFRPQSWFRQTCSIGLIGDCLDAGIVGNTTLQMYARFQTDVVGAGADVMVLMGGTNDMRHGASTAQILKRLKRLVAAAHENGIAVVLATVPARDGAKAGQQVLALNRAIRRWAAAADLPLLDMYGAVGTKSGTYQAGLTDDGLHPNVAGFTRMAAIAEAKLPGLLQEALAAQ